MQHADYVFVLAVLDRIIASPSETKFRQLKASARAVMRVKSFLLENGFRQHEDWLLFVNSDISSLENLKHQVQRLADETRDPESITFADVADILKREGTLPGIRTDIDDTPLGYNGFGESERPPKPWE